MQGDGIAQASGFDVDVCKDEPQQEGVKKLIQIQVKGGESECREENGGPLTEGACTVNEQAAEEELFPERCGDYG